MRNIFKIMLALLLVISVASCEKTNETGIKVSFIGKTSPVMKSTNTEGFAFTEAMIGVSEFEIKSEDESFEDSEMEVEIEYEGDYIVDLLMGTSDPDFGLVNIEPGMYDKFEVKFSALLDGGKSLILNGVYTDVTGNQYQFQFSSAQMLELEVELLSGQTLEEGTVLNLLISIDLTSLFSGASFANAVMNEMEVFEINETSNEYLYNIIVGNFDDSMEMEEEND